MSKNWISHYPQWFTSECAALSRAYPGFRIDERLLLEGAVCFYGELKVRPAGGARRQPVRLSFPSDSPFALPVVTPIERLPEFDEEGAAADHPAPVFFDERHQMPRGGLCLFQYRTRVDEGGESISAVDVLKRAEAWLMGHFTGRWPPDSQESELQAHFSYAGDILLSRTFYSSDVQRGGRFFAVRDVNRVLIEKSNVDPPLIMTVVTSIGESRVESVYDARSDLINIFPWLENNAWTPEEITAREEERDTDKYWRTVTESGYWWTLPSEPRVFHNGKGLLSVLSQIAPGGDSWSMLREQLGSDLTLRPKQLIGLRYPGRSGRDEWLTVVVRTGTQTLKSGIPLLIPDEDKRARFEAASVGCYHVHSATAAGLQLRNSSVIDTRISKKTVALIGLGALGSRVAELLAQAGIENFRLCDVDVLSIGNVARHVGGLREFGARKTRVVMRRLWDINPYLSVSDVLDGGATSSLERLQTFIDGADVVVCTTADEGVESAINGIAVETQTPFVYGRAMRRGSMGRVFVVRPNKDACKTCLSIYARNRDSRWISVPERPEDILLHECGRPVIPGSAADLSFVATLLAHQALEVLQERDLTKNHLVWSRNADLGVDSRFDSPFTVLGDFFEKLADCPTCQSPSLRGVTISREIMRYIEEEVTGSPTKETGGILIGHIDGARAVIIKATGPGPNAIRSEIRFVRDVEFAQRELDAATREHGDRGLYIGEWHSHLVTEPEPSGQDILSLSGIASAPNYGTRNPIMLISGFDRAKNRLGATKSWAFPVTGRFHEIPLSIE